MQRSVVPVPHFASPCAASRRHTHALRFARLLVDLEQQLHKNRASGMVAKDHTFVGHVFVTSAPKSDGGGQSPRPGRTPASARLTLESFQDALLHPSTSVKRFAEIVQGSAKAPNKMQDIYVWEGRPDWSAAFSALEDANTPRVGITYCGNPIIGKALRKATREHSVTGTRFMLRKEQF